MIIAKIRAGNTGKVRTPEHRAKVGAASRGRKQSQETIRKRIDNMPKTRNFGPPTEKQIAAARNARDALRSRYGPTRLELAVRYLLDSWGVEFYEQEPFGPYSVDFFIPKIGCVIEADGSFWHKSEAKERARDAYLLREQLVRSVVHLTEEQLKPWTPTKLEMVAYRKRNREAAA